MKKFAIVFLLISGLLYATGEKSTQKIYQTILSALVKTEKVRLYVSDSELRHILEGLANTDIVSEPQHADLIIVNNERSYAKINQMLYSGVAYPKYSIWFATDYRLLKEHEEIVGALYWKKGRSQLLFIGKRLKRYDLTLPQEFQHYIIEDL